MPAPPAVEPHLLERTHRLPEQTRFLLERTRRLAELLLDGPEDLAGFVAAHALEERLAGGSAHDPSALLAALPADELLARLRASFPQELAQRSSYTLRGVHPELTIDTAQAPFGFLLPARCQPFIGRQALLLQLRGALLQARRVALVGPRGVGKRALVREHVARSLSEHTLVAWLRARSPELLRMELLTLWARLVDRGLLEGGAEATNEPRLAQLLTRLAAEPRCLLVLDGAPATSGPELAQLCAGLAGSVVVLAPPQWAAAGFVPVTVPPLDPDEAVVLLCSASARHRLARGEAAAAREVAVRLGGRPADLIAAGREVAARGLTWSEYHDAQD